jgi:repressor LexA
MHRIQEQLLKLIGRAQIGGLTLREIGQMIDETSPQKIKHHLEKLQAKGLISLNRSQQTIALAAFDGESNLLTIPIIGAADCGPATIYTSENIQGYLKLSPKMINTTRSVARKEVLFALKANGQSLNRADINGKNIESGDFVIIDSTKTNPEDGDYVVSVIDGMANIKKFKEDRLNNRIVLLSESSHTIPPIFVHEEDVFTISGTVVDVVKKFTDNS